MTTPSLDAGAPPGAIDVIAHRGASAYAPENTLAAFRKSIEMNADWFELDCHLAADNEVVVSHDGDLTRTGGGPGKISELTSAELRTRDAGSWFSPEFAGERIPTLREALLLAGDRIGVYVEIKGAGDDDALVAEIAAACAGHDRMTAQLRARLMAAIEASGTRNLPLTRRTIETIRETRMERRVVIQSFSPVVCLIALAEADDIRTELLAYYDEKRPERWPQVLALSRVIDAAGLNVNHPIVTPELIADVHAQGRTIAVWTVNDAVDMRRLAEWGVDAIITNHPDVCLGVLKSMGNR